jgi:phage gpG-like protein
VVKKFLSWINSAGERIFAKSVTIPARPYLGFSTTAADRCVEALGDHVMEILA